MTRNARAAKSIYASASSKRSSFALFQGPKEIVAPRVMLLASVAILTLIGILMIFSASYIKAMSLGTSITSYMVSQVAYAVLGIAVCFVMVRVFPYKVWLGRWLDILWVAMLLLLVAVALFGVAAKGAVRWLVLGPISFQPSEFAKVVFLLMMARIMYQAQSGNKDGGSLGVQFGVYIVAPLLLVFFSQSDLGTTLICAVGLFTVAWLADYDLKALILIVVVLFILGVLAVTVRDFRSSRLNWLNPEADYYGSGYQLTRSLWAFGEGGLFGVGFGNSTEKYNLLPEIETDFIFAIIGEEFGLVGCLVVLALFIVLLKAGIDIARNAPDKFGAMVAGSCTSMLVFQAFLNMSCVIGLLPTTGKPLPFISSGGSSLIASFLLVGIILSVSFASQGDSDVYQRRRENFEVLSNGETRSLGSYTSGGSRTSTRAKSRHISRKR